MSDSETKHLRIPKGYVSAFRYYSLEIHQAFSMYIGGSLKKR